MADDPNDIAQKGLDELYKGQNVLGNPSELRLAGTGALPGGGGAAAALPAPAGPGGVGGGFLGGGGVGQRGRLDLSGKAVDLMGEVVKRALAGEPEAERGKTGGQSLSDRLRSGELQSNTQYGTMDPLTGLPLPGTQTQPTFNASGIPVTGFGETAPSGAGSITAGGGTTAGGLPMGTITPTQLEQGFGLPAGSLANFSPEDISAIMGGNLTPADLQQVLGVGETGMGAMTMDQLNALPAGTAGAGGMSGVGSLAGVLTGPALGMLANLATSTADPELRAAISGLVQAASPVVAPAVAGALGGTAAGAAAGGGLAGAGASLAAAAPGLVAAAPMVGMQIATSINGMLAQQALMNKLTGRFEDLQQSIPGHLAALQQAPKLLQSLEGVTDPQQAKQIYDQIEQIQQNFQQSGMEDFLQHGYTRATGDPAGGGWEQANFPQGPEIWKAMAPNLQALDIARMRAADIAARGGQPIAGARPLMDYTMLSPEYTKQLRPSVSDPAGQLGQLLGPTGLGTTLTSEDYSGAALPEGFMEQVASPDMLQFAGLPTTGQVPGQAGRQYTVGDIFSFLSPAGAGAGLVSGNNPKYTMTNYGMTNIPMYRELQAIQPGNYEAGLAQLFSQYGGMPEGLSRFGFGTGAMPVTLQQQQAGQLATNALGPGHGAFDALLSDEQKRQMGLL